MAMTASQSVESCKPDGTPFAPPGGCKLCEVELVVARRESGRLASLSSSPLLEFTMSAAAQKPAQEVARTYTHPPALVPCELIACFPRTLPPCAHRLRPPPSAVLRLADTLHDPRDTFCGHANPSRTPPSPCALLVTHRFPPLLPRLLTQPLRPCARSTTATTAL